MIKKGKKKKKQVFFFAACDGSNWSARKRWPVRDFSPFGRRARSLAHLVNHCVGRELVVAQGEEEEEEATKKREKYNSKIWAGTRQVMHRHTRTHSHIHTHTTGNKQLKGTSFFMELKRRTRPARGSHQRPVQHLSVRPHHAPQPFFFPFFLFTSPTTTALSLSLPGRSV